MITVWKQNTDVQFNSTWYQWHIGSTVEAVLPDVGIAVFYSDMIHWRLGTMPHLLGQNWFRAGSAAVSSGTIMSQSRSINRLVFSRVFGRIN